MCRYGRDLSTRQLLSHPQGSRAYLFQAYWGGGGGGLFDLVKRSTKRKSRKVQFHALEVRGHATEDQEQI